MNHRTHVDVKDVAHIPQYLVDTLSSVISLQQAAVSSEKT